MNEVRQAGGADWDRIAGVELAGASPNTLEWDSPEGIRVRPVYFAEDVAGLPHVHGAPGVFPFVRGPRATMYASRPWTVRQYAGFSTAEESNAFYRRGLASGQRGLSVAFDLPTHRGFDSDEPRVAGDVGKAGVAIDSVEDMKRLFEGIPLGDVSVSMTMNGAAIPIFAGFLVAAEEQGVPPAALSGTIQNDILKEFIVRNTYIYPPAPSMRIVADIIAFSSRNLPRFNPISISGYHMQEAGAPAHLELGYTLANGLEYVRAALSRGMKIDDFAPRLSFFFGTGTNFFMEIAKLRAARMLWASLLRERYEPRNPRSLELRTHCQTSGVSLTAQEPLNNVVRTAIEALAAVLGGTQSLHTNAYDEAMALPSDESARVALHTQLVLANECDLTRVIDPLGGSYYIEALTDALAQRARQIIDEVEKMGGMTKAIVAGIPKLRIEEAAARKQGRLDRALDVVVGVNKFRAESAPEAATRIRIIDNEEVRRRQTERLAVLRRTRDSQRVEVSLSTLEAAARSDGNLVEASLDAVRARATVGEISAILARVFGRHRAEPVVVSSVYSQYFGDDPEWEATSEAVREFACKQGRRPRLLVAKLGQDGHDRGANVIASSFADLGFDVDVGPMFQTPQEVAKDAVENDVDVVGVSSLAGAHLSLVSALLRELTARGGSDVRVVCGGIIPAEDGALLCREGVSAVFGPGTSALSAARSILELLGTPVRERSDRPSA